MSGTDDFSFLSFYSAERSDACNRMCILRDVSAASWLVYLADDLTAGAAPDAPPCGEGAAVNQART